MTVYSLLVSAAVGLLLLFPVSALVDWLVVARLRRFHPGVWRRLGDPSSPGMPSPATCRRLRHFFERGDHRALRDPTLEALVELSRTCVPLLLAALVLALFGRVALAG